MLKMPLISFIVTSFNYEKFILETLESIKAQTYKNFEIIVVDDCSTDNSIEIVENFISKNQDLRITLIKQSENKGQLFAMIRGLKEAQGQFVSFIDSDDVLFSDYAKNHLKVHLENSVAFTSCQITEIDENNIVHTFKSISSPKITDNKILTQVNNDVEGVDKILDEEIPYSILNHKRFGGWYWSPNSSAMFRKSSIEIILDYKNTDKWRICPDKFLFNLAHLIGGSAIIYKPLIGYRRHKNNAGNCTLVTGDKRLHSDKMTLINIKNNLNIYPETINFLISMRKKLGLRNVLGFILRILICI